ncbi:vWA domain-containing protein [Paractinoplanes lichenicola]|uniref:VWA domain-containing protein n=1 Tax=Paractinoplanes lichenicola TaxID=2802976 RepID=A0ABS1VUD6_9ACTN|nr:VWA domain-containing protein [Actinoplanes lichenicola]MBL7258043.1 VWA domain-containing protein [Actinoplanes lichenicola]
MQFEEIFGDDEEPDEFDFVIDTHRRRFVGLLIDTSRSMALAQTGGMAAIDALNLHLAEWLPKVRAEGRGQLRDVEFVVITFGAGGVAVASGNRKPSARDDGAFVPAARLTLGPLEAGGATPMVEAVDLALDLVEQRRRHVQEVHGQQCGGPRLILITDGEPTDFEGNPTDEWRRLAVRLQQSRETGRLMLFAFGVPGVKDDVMRELAGEEGYFRLQDLDLKRVLDLALVATAEHVGYRRVADKFEDGF